MKHEMRVALMTVRGMIETGVLRCKTCRHWVAPVAHPSSWGKCPHKGRSRYGNDVYVRCWEEQR